MKWSVKKRDNCKSTFVETYTAVCRSWGNQGNREGQILVWKRNRIHVWWYFTWHNTRNEHTNQRNSHAIPIPIHNVQHNILLVLVLSYPQRIVRAAKRKRKKKEKNCFSVFRIEPLQRKRVSHNLNGFLIKDWCGFERVKICTDISYYTRQHLPWKLAGTSFGRMKKKNFLDESCVYNTDEFIY